MVYIPWPTVTRNLGSHCKQMRQEIPTTLFVGGGRYKNFLNSVLYPLLNLCYTFCAYRQCCTMNLYDKVFVNRLPAYTSLIAYV